MLEDKITHISNENFHFREQMTSIKPFAYKKDDENDFYSAYCALKHDRGKNIKRANVHFLLRSLAAFYALCVIFDDKCTPIQNSIYGTNIPYIFTYNSDIFSANVYDRRLDFAQQSIMWSVINNKINNILDYQSIEDILRQCEKNLNIKFREQNPKECLFMAELTPEYFKRLNTFKAKYDKDNKATEN